MQCWGILENIDFISIMKQQNQAKLCRRLWVWRHGVSATLTSGASAVLVDQFGKVDRSTVSRQTWCPLLPVRGLFPRTCKLPIMPWQVHWSLSYPASSWRQINCWWTPRSRSCAASPYRVRARRAVSPCPSASTVRVTAVYSRRESPGLSVAEGGRAVALTQGHNDLSYV